ncbi:putative quinol monooxygenase [Sedimentitalea todarodis]|uniref:Quinol monooxygenase n=1 Tax=Sedimentitalea todarodis TaxID=1631240 RepID=A0ABU3V9Q8_9RHOB|nr:putative quinol monooxygenase [Sedimentitalea todarodis]MDU9002904.1 putative quinol monooxygenase [Sedimentitalea todarodis]
MFAVVVTFRIKPEYNGAFLPEMLQNAATSLAMESGCHRFDVCTDSARPEEVFLYELYEDRSAFDTHSTSSHFVEFDAKVARMVTSKEVRTYDQVPT